MISILIGLFLGLLFFPSPDFSKSILVGTLLPIDLFPQIISSSLLFWSFLIATLVPAIVIMNYDSFKRWQSNFEPTNCNLFFNRRVCCSFFYAAWIWILQDGATFLFLWINTFSFDGPRSITLGSLCCASLHDDFFFHVYAWRFYAFNWKHAVYVDICW